MLDVKYFAETLRKYRIEKGVTQNELARKLLVTPQSISKWERGEGMPELENLCALAQAFSVSIDVLIGNRRAGERTFIGISGGRRDRFVLVNDQGIVLDSATTVDNAPSLRWRIELLRQGIDSLRPFTMGTQAIYLIKSAAETQLGVMERSLHQLQKYYPDIKVAGCGLVSAIQQYEGVPPERTLVVIGGYSGCVTYWMCGDRYVCSGRGDILARPNGSRYNIGCDALGAVFAAQDGIGEATMLTGMVQLWLGGDPIKSYVPLILKRGGFYAASFAPLVFQAAEKGDKVARNILRTNAANLARLINAACKKTPQVEHIVLGSELPTTEDEYYYSLVAQQLDPKMNVIRQTTPMVWEACRRAAALCGADGEMSRARFELSYFDIEQREGLME